MAAGPIAVSLPGTGVSFTACAVALTATTILPGDEVSLLGVGVSLVNGTTASGPSGFLFRANFNASNQSLTNQQILSTQDKGVQDGKQLIVNSTAADTSAIASNELELSATSGGGTTWSPGYMGGIFPLTKGIAVHTLHDPATGGQGFVGIGQPYYSANPFSNTYGYWFLGGNLNATYNGVSFQLGPTYTAGTDNELLILYGGSDVNGVPWDGTSSWDYYNYGQQLFQYSSGAWNWLFTFPTNVQIASGNLGGANGSMATAGAAQYAGSTAVNFKDVVVQDADYSGVLKPVYRDTSPALLASYTAGAGDQIIRFKVTALPATSSISIQFRITDALNYWSIGIDSSGNLTLNETVAGSLTTRGTIATTVAAGHQVLVNAIGTTITVFDLSASSQIIYASASSGQTQTGVSIASLGVGGTLGFIAGFNNDGFGASALPPAMSVVSFTVPAPSNAASGSATKQLSIDGDSEVDPDGLNRGGLESYLPFIMGGQWTVSNFAVSGSQVSDLVSREATVNATYNAGNARNELIIWAGTNNGYTGGQTGAVAATAMQSYLTTELGVGWKITFIAMLPRAQTGGSWPTGGSTVFRAAYNSAMQTFCAANSIRYLDPTANGQMTDSTDANYYRNDPVGVHLGYYSEGIVSRQLYDAIGR